MNDYTLESNRQSTERKVAGERCPMQNYEECCSDVWSIILLIIWDKKKNPSIVYITQR